MALLKSYTAKNGLAGEYWKLGKGDMSELPKMYYDKKNGKLVGNATLCLYKDEETRNNVPYNPLKEFGIRFEFNATDYPTLAIPLSDFYNYVKANFKISHFEPDPDGVLGSQTEVVDFDLTDAIDV